MHVHKHTHIFFENYKKTINEDNKAASKVQYNGNNKSDKWRGDMRGGEI